jgi:hypothetical protein
MTVDELAERGIRVKPLVWGHSAWKGWKIGIAHAPGYPMLRREDGWHWGGDVFPTLQAAKAAAEADHAARIAAQLECSREACEGPGVTG